MLESNLKDSRGMQRTLLILRQGLTMNFIMN
jgi:hypothetical protein